LAQKARAITVTDMVALECECSSSGRAMVLRDKRGGSEMGSFHDRHRR